MEHQLQKEIFMLHIAKINMSETIICYSVDFRLNMKNSRNVGTNVCEKKCFIKLAYTVTIISHILLHFATKQYFDTSRFSHGEET
jgi:hypothetical protein